MEVRYSSKALHDIELWKKSGQKQSQKKIQALISSIESSPYSGIGSPEQLKYELSEYWSRRIDKANRIIYKVVDDAIFIYSLRGHYLDK